MVKRERRVVHAKVPHHTPFHFIDGFVKDRGFCNIILKCDNEPSTKALIDTVMRACVGVEVIPHGPLDGDHMAIGRVEMAVRDVKRQCRTLRTSPEHHTGVRIEDDSPSLSWLLRFRSVSQMGDDPIGTLKIQIE